MKERELRTIGLEKAAAGVSESCEPRRKNDAATLSVVDSSMPRDGMDENTGKACASAATARW